MALMTENGCEVVVIDVSAITLLGTANLTADSKTLPHVTILRAANNSEFVTHLRSHANAKLIVFLAQSGNVTPNNLGLLRAISRAPTPYMIWNVGTFPGWEQNTFRNRIGDRAENLFSVLRNKDYRASVISRLPLWLLNIRPADIVLSSDVQGQRRSRLQSPKSRVIQAHHPDYDVFMAKKKMVSGIMNQAVFIDQNKPFHHDYQQSRTKPVEATKYYTDLERFFVYVEQQLGLEVVIAAHPRTKVDQIRRHIGDRKLIQNQTPELIISSKLVLAHTSTAISMAVMDRKPVVIISNKELWRIGWNRCLMREMAKYLNAPIIFVDEELPNDMDSCMEVDPERYDSYFSTFIKRDSTPDQPIWEIARGELSDVLKRSLI